MKLYLKEMSHFSYGESIKMKLTSFSATKSWVGDLGSMKSCRNMKNNVGSEYLCYKI